MKIENDKKQAKMQDFQIISSNEKIPKKMNIVKDQQTEWHTHGQTDGQTGGWKNRHVESRTVGFVE